MNNEYLKYFYELSSLNNLKSTFPIHDYPDFLGDIIDSKQAEMLDNNKRLINNWMKDFQREQVKTKILEKIVLDY